MPFPKIYIDALLVNWGDRLFHDPLRHARAPRLSQWTLRQDALRLREKLIVTLRGAPEVMVKISNTASGAQGMRVVRRHLQYISRNGCVELEDQDGRKIAGKAALQDLFEQWHLGGWGIPQESKRRETLNVLLSMPPGTNRQAVRDAARAFAQKTFGDGRPYVFAEHNDEDHPHVHLSVHARGPDGRRLNPRKQDLHHWREVFAQQLREHGVDANATPRMVRGQTRRFPKQAVIWIASQGILPRSYSPVIDDRTRQALWAAHTETLSAWHEIARTLANSNAPEDRAMAIDIADFVWRMPIRTLSPLTVLQRRNSSPQLDKSINRGRATYIPNSPLNENNAPSPDIDLC
ncbi:relaxase/mobilization nuclease domain-containing protein [Burkholderia pyrrocinia]|uniref:relaxase/mobilization nuclease domain-containing protein n=1 Tax=Burkholderia pyrrocinia TaxID=60550 RepID=UPI00158B4421|nr:relaxase/mobilization nuclease domain-containing protein [Burkholderia pyrrocinia]